MANEPERPRVGVVIPAYNSRSDLHECLTYLGRSTYPHLEIVVVDNASIDDTVEYVKTHWPKLRLLLETTNTGYVGACRRGVRELEQRDVSYVALLNQDVMVKPDWLEPLVDYLEAHVDAAAAQPFILRSQNERIVNSLGNHINFLGFGFAGGDGDRIENSRVQRFLKGPSEVTYTSGAAMLFRMDVVRQIGLFEDDFFMYHEDLDLGWRIRLAGWHSALVPNARVIHRYEFGRSARVKYEFGERNRLLVLLMNYHWLTWLLIFPAWFSVEIGVVTLSILKGWLPEKMRGYRYVILNLRQILEARRRHQALRRVAEHEVVRPFRGDISYQVYTPLVLRIANPLLKIYWSIIRRLIVW